MTCVDRLSAIEAIKQTKARYLRGVDTGDGELVRSVVAPDCILDYTDCFVDPASGTDFFPELSIVLQGRAAYAGNGLAAAGIVSCHQGPNCEIEIDGDAQATGIWAMTDRLFLPAGSVFAELAGFGHYFETYTLRDGLWLIQTLRLQRTRIFATAWPRSPV